MRRTIGKKAVGAVLLATLPTMTDAQTAST